MRTTPAAPLMTAKEVALFLRVEVRTVRRWVYLGRLRSLRVGMGHLRFRRSEVIRAIERAEDEEPQRADPSMG